MTSLYRRLHDRLLSDRLSFRVRLFNVLAIVGIVVSFVSMVTVFLFDEARINAVVYGLACLLSALLLWYSCKSGRYQLCYIITIVSVFLVGFTTFFFLNGAYYGAAAYFFIFAVVFTVFMLEGAVAVLLAVLELVVYIGACVIAYRFIEPSPRYFDGHVVMLDCIFGFTVVSIALGAAMFILFRMYNAQQRKLSEQNRILESISQMKTEFFASVSHEMKTPLTVISVHIQRAQALLEMNREGDVAKVRESHSLALDEIMRISRMVDSALRISSLQEFELKNTVLNLAEILRATGEAYRTLLEKNENVLELDLPDTELCVLGNPDALVQLVSNLISNAYAHTRGGRVTIRARRQGDQIIASVADTGEGIPACMMEKIFERGVTDGGGHGLGLAICRQLARSHGGDISLQSEQGRGTVATLTLPEHREGELHG